MGGFKLLHTQLRDNNASLPTGTAFPDSVAIGDYNDDTHHLAKTVCTYPPCTLRPMEPSLCFATHLYSHLVQRLSRGCRYMAGAGEGGKPYFIPLRALMVASAPNLLAAGKLMSQSFHANSNTRLHPRCVRVCVRVVSVRVMCVRVVSVRVVSVRVRVVSVRVRVYVCARACRTIPSHTLSLSLFLSL